MCRGVPGGAGEGLGMPWARIRLFPYHKKQALNGQNEAGVCRGVQGGAGEGLGMLGLEWGWRGVGHALGSN